MKMKSRLRLLTDHQALVWRLRDEEGLRYRDIAEGLGITVGAVRSVVAAARKQLADYEANPGEGFAVLPMRTRKVLEYMDFTSRSEVMEAVKSGLLYYDPHEHLHCYDRETGRRIEKTAPGKNFARMRNAGWGSWAAVLEWLNLPVPDGPERRPRKT